MMMAGGGGGDGGGGDVGGDGYTCRTRKSKNGMPKRYVLFHTATHSYPMEKTTKKTMMMMMRGRVCEMCLSVT